MDRPFQSHSDGPGQGQVDGSHPVQIDDLTVGDADKAGGVQPLLQLVQPQMDRVDLVFGLGRTDALEAVPGTGCPPRPG